LVARAGSREASVTVEAIEVVDGRVSAVRTNKGRHDIDGRLVYTGPLPKLASLLGDAIDDGLRWDLSRLVYRHRVQVSVTLENREADLAAELHVLSADSPFFRITTPGSLPGGSELASVLTAHLTCFDGDELWESSDDDLGRQVVGALAPLGLSGVQTAAIRVQRFAHYDPAWIGSWHPVMIRVLLAMEKLGLELAGRSGAYQWVDPGRELLHLAALSADASSNARELVRTLLDPPVKGDAQRITMAHFVTA
jgi:protoporphyrinogen oxidase